MGVAYWDGVPQSFGLSHFYINSERVFINISVLNIPKMMNIRNEY